LFKSFFVHAEHRFCVKFVETLLKSGLREWNAILHHIRQRVDKRIYTFDIMLHLPRNFDPAKNNAVKYYALKPSRV